MAVKGGVCFVTAKHLFHYSVEVCPGVLHPVAHSLACSLLGDPCDEFGQGQEPMDSTNPLVSISGGSNLLGARDGPGGGGGDNGGNSGGIGGCGGCSGATSRVDL